MWQWVTVLSMLHSWHSCLSEKQRGAGFLRPDPCHVDSTQKPNDVFTKLIGELQRPLFGEPHGRPTPVLTLKPTVAFLKSAILICDIASSCCFSCSRYHCLFAILCTFPPTCKYLSHPPTCSLILGSNVASWHAVARIFCFTSPWCRLRNLVQLTSSSLCASH